MVSVPCAILLIKLVFDWLERSLGYGGETLESGTSESEERE